MPWKQQLNAADMQFCYNTFDKVRTFKKILKWDLPPKENLFTEDKNSYKDQGLIRLNTVKSKLNDYPRSEWSMHTKRRNLFGKVKAYLKFVIKSELPTQSWGKMYEIIQKFELIPRDATYLNTFHISEAPGAFICALNHYLKTKQPCEWTWRATSMNPFYEGNDIDKLIMDDRFIIHTFNNWCFGDSYSGDIFESATQNDIKNRCQEMGMISLVTADGSVNCMDNPRHQEETVSNLVWMEVLTALDILAEGGHFFFKIFTIFESSTACLVYLVNCCFQTVHLVKPMSSRESSSELYVVCKGFLHGKDSPISEYLAIIRHKINSPELLNKSIFPQRSLPMTYLQQIQSFMEYFVDLQVNAIEGNIAAFPSERNKTEQYRRNSILDQLLQIFKEKYPVTPLLPEDCLVPNDVMAPRLTFKVDNYNCYTMFLKRQKFNDQEKKEDFRQRLEDYNFAFIYPYESDTIVLDPAVRKTVEEILQSDIELKFGKEITEVKSSLFVSKDVFLFLRELSQVKWDLGGDEYERIVVTEDKISVKLNVVTLFSSLKDYEFKFFHLFAKALNETPDNLTISNTVLFGQKMVGLIYVVSELSVGESRVTVTLNRSGTMTLSGLTQDVKSEISKLIEVFEIENRSICGVVKMPILRTSHAFQEAVRIFNEHSLLTIYNHVLKETNSLC